MPHSQHPANPTPSGSTSPNHRAQSFLSWGMALGLFFGPQTLPAQSPPRPDEMVDALNGVFGRHAKQRGSHAKGFCVAGYFVPAATGKDFAATPLVQADRIPVSARFSIGGGNPNASDKGRSVRGFAARFHIGKSEELDLVLISAPVFFAATPSQFIDFLKARTPAPATGKKDPDKIKTFNRANPNVLPHLNYLSKTAPPASYATTPYFSTHAFYVEGVDGEQRAARWVLEPVTGYRGLTKAEEESFPTSFLEEEMRTRLAKGEAAWDIYLQLAQAGDSLVDPSAVWPDTREKVRLGRLNINRMIETGSPEDCRDTVFDPNRLPSGIRATEDPILAIRSPAYAISLQRRQQ